MSYGNPGQPQQGNYAPSQHPTVQQNGFIDPQQLVTPVISPYATPNVQNFVPNAQAPHFSPQLVQHHNNLAQQYTPLQQQTAYPSSPAPHLASISYSSIAHGSNGIHQQHYPAYPVHDASNVPTYQPQSISTPLPQQRQPQPPTPPQQPEISLDYRQLLTSMAEEYFSAAWKLGAVPDTLCEEDGIHEYYRLITIGLGCLEAILKHFKLPPEMEANVRLRYASILYDETENVMEAEEVLSKGISLCTRHRFDDTKYNMQHILIRILFRRNSRAALKFLERAIADAQAYQHTAWVYAFRFLRVSLHLELASRQDMNFALGQLRAIASLASEQGHKFVTATATTMEALICLRNASDSEGFEQAQRALASVRSLQHEAKIGVNVRLSALASFADISCHLQRLDPEQALVSDKNLRESLDRLVKDEETASDSSFMVPLGAANVPPLNQKNGVIRRLEDGSAVLVLKWMPTDDIYNIGFLLGGMAMVHKNTVDGHKSERMFQEGIKQQAVAQQASNKMSKSIVLSASEKLLREQMTYRNRLRLASTLAARTCWNAAKDHISDLKDLYNAWPDVPDDLFLLTQYLKGTIAQGTGDLITAIALYDTVIESANRTPTSQAPQTPLHSPSPSVKPLAPLLLNRDLSTLSTLNKLLIIRNPAHPSHNQCGRLLATLTPHCTSNRNPNRSIPCAYHLLNSVLPSTNPSAILATKNSLHSALQTAKLTANNQLVCIVLNIMSWKFFSGVVGDQAEKSARASQSLAKKGGDTLWMCTASGVLAKTLEAAGKVDEAEVCRRTASEWARELPGKVREYAEVNGDG